MIFGSSGTAATQQKGTIATNNQFLRTTSPQQFASSSPLRNCIFKRTPRESKFLEIAERVKDWGSTSNSMCLNCSMSGDSRQISVKVRGKSEEAEEGELKILKVLPKSLQLLRFLTL